MHPFHRLDLDAYRLPSDFERILSPTLVVFLDQVRENLRRMGAALGGDWNRWRPHVKTSKIPAVFQEVARAGVRHFKCATTRDCRVLLDALADAGVADADVLLAYPLVSPALEELGRIAARHPDARVSVLCEDPERVAQVPAPLGIFVDVNPGMDRTGIPAGDRDPLRETARAAGSRLRGLHYYDGHLHDGDEARRRERAFAGYQELWSLVQRLQAEGLPVGEVITSGTPTFPHALAFEAFATPHGFVHRVSPGTVVYHDLRSADLTELDLVPAALVFARVVSHPRADRVTCDAGSKSLAAEAGDPCALALGHPRLQAERPSEEHLPFTVREGPAPARGTPLLLVPAHVCPTVNLAEQAVLMEGGAIREVVEVSARAHDLWAGGAAHARAP